MKTRHVFSGLMLAVLPLLGGCEGDGHVHGGYSDYAALSYAPYRLEYHVGVSVSDPWGFALSAAGVELIVADVPEYSVYSTTDRHGVCDFWIEAPPGALISVFVDGRPFGDDYITLVTDEYTTDLYVDVRL